MRNPNGYGSVTKLSGTRRRPYMVKKTKGFDERGYPIVAVIGYAATREEGMMLLAQYNMEPWDVDTANITLQGLFDLWLEQRVPKMKESTARPLRSAFKYCQKYVAKPYREIKAYHMQDTIDNCGKGYSTQGNIKSLWYHLDNLARELDIIKQGYADLTHAEPIPDTTKDRFSDGEINHLWEHQDEPWVDTVLILIYSGWRFSEFLGLTPDDIDLDKGIMLGGVKTAAGKNRVVPIHPLIRPFIEKRLAEGGETLITFEGNPMPEHKYREIWSGVTNSLGIKKTPHECRHTLESLMDSAGANRKCIDLIMGHKSKDVGNRVYNHKTLNQLKEAIELVTH